ncbi:MAG: class I tRNA ligase family protein, partial [Bacteroidota bacterium]
DKSMFPGATIEDKLGKMINSGFLDGMEVLDAIEAILLRIENMGIGKRRINYKLRDAIYSRQRYWGEPFPIAYDPDGVAHPMPDQELPLELPELEDFKPASGAKSPLARVEDWVNLPNGWKRETDTMPGFAGSSWYFLRYMDARNDEEFASQKTLNYWRDVDLYVGGTEHAVGHLMYSRMWHKFLYDKGLVPTKEPYRKLLNQGMIQGKSAIMEVVLEGGRTLELHVPVRLVDENWRLYLDKFEQLKNADSRFEPVSPGSNVKVEIDENGNGYIQLSQVVEKMSKSLHNVINPDDVIEQHGADCFRMYEMFLGPIEQAKPWDTKGINGVSNFLRKFWSLFFDSQWNFLVSNEAPTKQEMKTLHTCIKKVSEDIERFSFNTCVSGFMICVNELRSGNCNKRAVLDPLVRLVAPFAPHLAEELWHRLGHANSVCVAPYPVHKDEHLVQDTIHYPVSINGKKRDLVELPAGLPVDELEKLALGLESVRKWTDGQTVKKVVVVPGRMINIVVG